MRTLPLYSFEHGNTVKLQTLPTSSARAWKWKLTPTRTNQGITGMRPPILWGTIQRNVRQSPYNKSAFAEALLYSLPPICMGTRKKVQPFMIWNILIWLHVTFIIVAMVV